MSVMPRTVGAADGFTLVEMLLVLVLIAILTGSVVVSLRGREDDYELRTSAQDVAAVIQYGNTQARIERIPYRVVLGSGGRSFHLESGRGGDFVPARGMAGQERVLPRSVAIVSMKGMSDGQQQLKALMLTGDGTGFAGQVTLKSDDGASITVEVLPITGQVVLGDRRQGEQTK